MRAMDRLSSLVRKDRADPGLMLTEFYFHRLGLL